MDPSQTVRLHLILLAGGKGLRAAVDDQAPPKQFQKTARGPLYLVCLQEFLKLQTPAAHPLASLTIAIPESWRPAVEKDLTALEHPPSGVTLKVPWNLAPAGATRTESTWSAICALLAGESPPVATDLVAVHDAARPFASSDLLARLSAAARQEKAAVPGIPVPDSLVQVGQSGDSSQKGSYVDRATVFAVQTPQVFQWDVFLAAHTWAAHQKQSFTDDGSLLAQRGIMPQVIAGEPGNWKVTTPMDSDRAVIILGGHPF